MHSSPHDVALGLVDEDSVPGEVDEKRDELRQQVAVSEERIAKLQGELEGAADQEAETAQRFDRERKRRVALDRQLNEAREEASSLMLDEASRTRSAMLAEAGESLQTSRVEAEREAGQIAKQAFEKAKEMVAAARRESLAIVDAGRVEVAALEAEAARRIADLDTERQDLAYELKVMTNLYDELQAILATCRRNLEQRPR